MGRKVNVVLPSGEVVSIDEALLPAATGGQVREETLPEADVRLRAAANERQFSSLENRVLTFGEGVASTLSLGFADEAMDDEATRLRAQINPGTRLAGELTGAFVPVLGTAGRVGRAVRALTPAGRLIGATEALGATVGGTKGMVLTAGLQGAGFGLGGVVSKAALSDDQLTLEAALHGMGKGALIGTGLGVVAGGLAKYSQAAKRAGELSSKTGELDAALAKEVPQIEAALGDLQLAQKDALLRVRGASAGYKDTVSSFNKQLDEVRSALATEFPEAREVLQASKGFARAASRAKTADDAFAALDKQSELLSAASNGRFTHTPFAFAGKLSAETERLATMSLPKTMAEFRAMRPQQLAEMLNGLSATESAAARKALTSLDDAARAAGMGGDSLVASVSGLHGALMVSEQSPGLFQKLGSKLADSKLGGIGSIGRAIGAYAIGGPGFAAAEILGFRAAITKQIKDLVVRYGESAASGLAKTTPLTAILSRPLLGGDEETGTQEDLALRRMEELYRILPATADAMYSVLAPLSQETGLPFAQGLAGHVNQSVQKLAAAMPKDNGLTVLMGKSQWRPSLDQIETLSAVLEASQDPWAAIERQLAGEGSPAAADALWDQWPATMNELRTEVFMNLDKLSKLPYNRVLALSTTLRAPFDSLLTPENLSALQSTFIPGNLGDRAATSTPVPSGPPGRPPRSLPPTGGTMVQNLTSR
jgi:hypothetical protein